MSDVFWVGCAIAMLALGVYWWASQPIPAPDPSRRKPETSPRRALPKAVDSDRELPVLSFQEDEDELDPTKVNRGLEAISPPTMKIVYDEDAALDEPTQNRALIFVTGAGQTDRGLRRKRNEDRLLVLADEGLFAVADGMGGYRGGELASDLCVQTIARAFKTHTFEGAPHEALPRRASELARAIQMANAAIFAQAANDKLLQGMGTTVSVARFSPNKQRLYIAHVGDSRVYCYRDGTLRQMTADHTMKDLGVGGEGAGHLSRAVGIWPTVPIDIVLGKPRPGDVYLLCSDGLTKMVEESEIETALRDEDPNAAVDQLIAAANAHGGRDNISVVVVRVGEPIAVAA
jgi:protein phosphatase